MQAETNMTAKRSLVILGDSYSTFEGWNPDGQHIYYPSENIPEMNRVELTWWHQFVERNQLLLLKNDSWSGSTVCTTVRPSHPVDSAFVKRMKVTLNGGFQTDMICIFGGTNDSWIDCPIGENQYQDWSENDIQAVLPAFCCLLDYTLKHNQQAQIFCVLNSELKNEITQGMVSACQHYGVACIQLQEIEKCCGHPTANGMRQIAEQVTAVLEEV